jgi:hypothetical protein
MEGNEQNSGDIAHDSGGFMFSSSLPLSSSLPFQCTLAVSIFSSDKLMALQHLRRLPAPGSIGNQQIDLDGHFSIISQPCT